MSGSPVAFLSYAHADDERFGGLISGIKTSLERAVREKAGPNFEIFQDRGMEPGTRWARHLDDKLLQASIFLPVISKNFFASEHCVAELLKYRGIEIATERDETVIPILLEDVDEVDGSWGELADLSRGFVNQRQYLDFRNIDKTRIHSEEREDRIVEFAGQLVSVLERLAEQAALKRSNPNTPWAPWGVAVALAVAAVGLAGWGWSERQGRQVAESAANNQSVALIDLEELSPNALRNDLAAKDRELSEMARQREELTLAVEELRAELERRVIEPAVGPLEIIQDCDECPEMVVLPAGEFMMGSPEGKGYGDERPQHLVTIAEPFAVGRFEVTFDEWDACVEQGGCGGHKPEDEGWGRGRRPVINVSWGDAKAYVEWLSERTGDDGYRLLSESEWEYAARAGTETPYFFGSEITSNQADFRRNLNETTEVGSYPPNSFGLYDMHGNVWEWCEDVWHDSYEGAPSDGAAWTEDGDQSRRVLRGGSWYNYPRYLRSANRNWGLADDRGINRGFRVARTLR